jgi:putative transposase
MNPFKQTYQPFIQGSGNYFWQSVYIGGTISNHDGVLLKAGSVSDHIHLLISHPRTMSPADLVKEIKIASSKWIKDRDRRLAGFHWQSGYGMFSISP